MAHTLEDVLAAGNNGDIDKLILPVDSIFSGYPAITLSYEETHRCKNGALCRYGKISEGKYRFYGPDNEFILLGNVVNGEIVSPTYFFNPE
jgi:hypothetical protein